MPEQTEADANATKAKEAKARLKTLRQALLDRPKQKEIKQAVSDAKLTEAGKALYHYYVDRFRHHPATASEPSSFERTSVGSQSASSSDTPPVDFVDANSKRLPVDPASNKLPLTAMRWTSSDEDLASSAAQRQADSPQALAQALPSPRPGPGH